MPELLSIPKKLSHSVYRYFYNKDLNNLLIPPPAGKSYLEIQDLKSLEFLDKYPNTEYKDYIRNVLEQVENIKKWVKEKRYINLLPRIDWLIFSWGKKNNPKSNTERKVFLNFKPEFLLSLIKELEQHFQEYPIGFKASSFSKIDNFNRCDKGVIYYDLKEFNKLGTKEEDFLDQLKDFYSKYSDYFNEGIPHLSKPLENTRGISYADEPLYDIKIMLNASFGFLRSIILAEIIGLMENQGENLSIQNILDPNIWKKYHVDPDDLAFNVKN